MAPTSGNTTSGFGAEWQAAFGNSQETPQEESLLSGLNFDSFLPSKMLENWPKDGTQEEMMPLCPEQNASEVKKVCNLYANNSFSD